ncbi:MAG TPA: hypothetical protein VF015_13780 [Acidimicrobiales bacterium]
MTAADITNGQLMARVLRAAGVDAVYGAPLAGVRVVPVPLAPVAALMAEAHRRVHGCPAGVLRADGTLVVGAGAVVDRASAVVSDVADLLDGVGALHAAAHDRGPGLAWRVALDPDAPAPDVAPPRPAPVDRWAPPGDDLVATLAAAERPVVLAGPGVVREGAVPGLHAAATAANLGVLNTWGAKGVFDWRSRHHLATAGLQARDFELGGLADADLIVATGVDPAEAPGDRWRLAPVVEVLPGALDPLAGRWARRLADIAVPALRSGLARVTQDGWASTSTPLAPSRVTRHYAQVVGAGGLLAADPGVAGYWVARTFATTELGGVHVPASPSSRGFSVACAAVARLRSPDRPVLAVVDSPDGPVFDALDTAWRLGVDVPVEVWAPDGEHLDADRHLARLRRIVDGGGRSVVGLATDAAQLDRMIEVAGEVVAWTA